MKFLCLIYGDEARWQGASPAELADALRGYDAFDADAEAVGALVGGEGLEPTSAAVCVRVRGGRTMTTDGPFAETKEQLGGYYLLDCKDLDEAIAWAAKIPGASDGTVEVRPVMDLEAVYAAAGMDPSHAQRMPAG